MPRYHSRRAVRRRRSNLARAWTFVALCGLALAPADAAPPFALSSCDTCDQNGAGAIAANPQGAFATAWTGSLADAPHGAATRFFRPGGTPQTADVALSNASAFADGDTAVAANANGLFASAWSRKDGLNSEIFVQRFARSRAKLGAPLPVSVDGPGALKIDFAPTLTFLPDRSFVVVWERYGPAFQGGESTPVEVMARRFRWIDGKPFGPPEKVNAGLVDTGHAALCAMGPTQIAVAWTTLDRVAPFQSSRHGVALRRLTPNGQALGAEVVVAPPAASQGGVALACSAAGLTAVWRTDQPPASERAIVGRRVGWNGAVLGDAFLISRADVAHLSAPAAAEDVAGTTFVSWTEADGVGSHVALRSVSATGGTSPIRAVANGTGQSGLLLAPAIGRPSDAGELVVVWTEDGNLLGRRFSSALAPLRTSFVLAADETEDAPLDDATDDGVPGEGR